MIRLVIGLVLGALGGMTYARSSRFQKQVEGKGKKLKELGDGFRLPLPATVVDLPLDLEDMNLIDDVICDCARAIKQAQPELEEANALAQALQLCAAVELYAPDEIQWPPVPGDHPTIHQLWGILGYRARRLIVRGEIDQVCVDIGEPPAPKPGFSEQPAIDEWQEPVGNQMIEQGQHGPFRWRTYLDNVERKGEFYWKTWRDGNYTKIGFFNTAEEAKNSVVAWMDAQLPKPGIKGNPYHHTHRR